MIVKEEFLSRLRKIFDLNLYEVKVWTALLSRGTSTAGELSNISDVPRSRTYDILESLEKKGFIIMRLGKPIKFVALKPEEVIERVKKRQKRVVFLLFSFTFSLLAVLYRYEQYKKNK